MKLKKVPEFEPNQGSFEAVLVGSVNHNNLEVIKLNHNKMEGFLAKKKANARRCTKGLNLCYFLFRKRN